MKRLRLPLAALVVLSAAAVRAADYAVLKSVPVSGDGGWDYVTVDAVSRRLYLSHGMNVDVLDLDSLVPVGEISDTPGVHGVAIDPARHRGFITCGRAGRVDIFDPDTRAKTGSVPVGQNPDALTLDPATGRLFVFNGRDGTASVLEGEVVAATVPLGGRPEAAVADGRGAIFVNLADKGRLADIDANTMKVRRSWKLDGCQEPTGLAIDPATRRLFSGCRNRVLVESDADLGKTIASVPIGEYVDGVAFDPGTRFVFASNGDGTVTQILEEGSNRLAVVSTIRTERGARTMDVDPKTHRLFLPTAAFGTAPNPRARPPIKRGTFHVLVVGEK